ncbi:hypothetical protein F384_12780 [Citrobacter amalonaticus Y19]|uniref:HTH luxR-type domain-containing protein n=2 Tax=Citrobacter amalonaticus TaxID=35703 RepID=A0A0F6RFG0_CITAM|nr:hypothetical protein F384_12780 [Citrobacter amalonaticus Y19]
MKQPVIIFSEKKVYKLIEIVCGRGCFLIESNSSLRVFSEKLSFFITYRNFVKGAFPVPKRAITEIEFRIMIMISMGWSLTRIALSMNRSVKTISTHKTNISQKLGLNSQQLKAFLAREDFLNYLF